MHICSTLTGLSGLIKNKQEINKERKKLGGRYEDDSGGQETDRIEIYAAVIGNTWTWVEVGSENREEVEGRNGVDRIIFYCIRYCLKK